MKENEHFLIQTDYYSSIPIVCTYVEGDLAYFVSRSGELKNYKYKISTQKLFVFNVQYQSWDTLPSNMLKPDLKVENFHYDSSWMGD